MELRRKINGTSWTFRIVNSKEMKKQQAGSIAGLCVPSEKTVYIHQDNVDYETIVHELFHSYVSDLHLDDTNTIPLSDVEEIFASLFSAKGEKICRQARNITKDLKKLQQGDE